MGSRSPWAAAMSRPPFWPVKRERLGGS
jgi:hypothetical protein